MFVNSPTENEMTAAPRAQRSRVPLRIKDENQVIRAILQGTATHTGARFFEALVQNLARALGTYSAWVTEYLEEARQLRALAFCVNGRLAERFLVDIDGTPCAAVVDSTELVHFPENVLDLYPGNAALHDLKAVSYLGAPLLDDNRRVLGNLAVLDRRPMPREHNLLPKRSPRVRGLDLAGRTLSCDEIGGDYFDYLPSQGCAASHLDIVVGDVSGHGVEAALLMATSRALLRTQVGSDSCRPLSAVVTALNRQLAVEVSDSGRFMTLFYLRIDLETRRLRWVRAGHPAALFFDPRADSFRELGGRGVALGVASDWAYTEETGPQATTGILTIATDGLCEARDKQQRPYGQKRFRDILRRHAALGAEAIIDKVYADLADHSLGVLPEDDITLVIVKFDGGIGAALDYHI
jgi:hypothetical protein